MFKLLQGEDLLEHVKELFLGHDEFTVQALLHPARALALLLSCRTRERVMGGTLGKMYNSMRNLQS